MREQPSYTTTYHLTYSSFLYWLLNVRSSATFDAGIMVTELGENVCLYVCLILSA